MKSLISKQNTPQLAAGIFITSKSTLMITMIEDSKKVVIKRIGENKEVVAFQRKGGIAAISAKQDSNGKINLLATFVFKNKKLEDAEKYYDQSE